MKKNKLTLPKSILKNMVAEVAELINTFEGQMLLIDMFEEIPYHLRPLVIDGISGFHNKELAVFVRMLKEEYGRELSSSCDRAMEKYRLAGISDKNEDLDHGEFFQAFTTRTRQTGRISLHVAWKTNNSSLRVESFGLSFGQEGIYNFLVAENFSFSQFKKEYQIPDNLVQVSMAEACYLITQAYQCNVCHMSRPAPGKFLYNKYFISGSGLTRTQQRSLIKMLTPKLNPRRLVNTFLQRLKKKDFSFIFSLLPDYVSSYNLVAEVFSDIIGGATLLEGQVREVSESRNGIRVSAYSITVNNHDAFLNEYSFFLMKDLSGERVIKHIQKDKCEVINESSSLNPFNCLVYCHLYEILDLDQLFQFLNQVDNLQQVEEMAYGIHLRIVSGGDAFNQGVSFIKGSFVDIVINGEELVVMAGDPEILAELAETCGLDDGELVQFRGEYEVNLVVASKYVEGEYLNFEDILAGKGPECSFENGMRFFSARYFIKDDGPVLDYINDVQHVHVKNKEGHEVYFQFNSNGIVEYVLTKDWITVSTFGELGLSNARYAFEKGLYDCLEFDGIEVREEGIFEILTPEIEKQYPGLEKQLKDAYLNTWYYSQLVYLCGMSPREACLTEEGRRLLWQMLKKISQENKNTVIPRKTRIGLTEYLHIIEQKNSEIL